jgi:acyl transferase domain-containing protein
MRIKGLKHYVESNPGLLGGVAHTLGERRDHLPHRSFCIADDSESSLDFETSQKAGAKPPAAVFVFNGQGAQWAGMGKSLIRSSPSFRQDIREMDQVLQSLVDPPRWTIEGLSYLSILSCTCRLLMRNFRYPLW